MKRIKNKHAFATGVITAAGALICAAVIAAQGFQPRLAISLLLLAAWSAVSLSAGSRKRARPSARPLSRTSATAISSSAAAMPRS